MTSFAEELRLFLRARLAEDVLLHEAHVTGHLAEEPGTAVEQGDEAVYALARAYAIHSQALLRIAEEIDKLREEG